MLYSLMNGRARTATELALVADVSPSTASAHLNRLTAEHLVRVVAQGKHRYYSIDTEHVASLLESLSVLAGASTAQLTHRVPTELRAARTCYDHLAGTLGVALHDRLCASRWLARDESGPDDAYTVTDKGAHAFGLLDIDVDATRRLRRRFAFACLDWSERRPHVGGALGAALLRVALHRRWLTPDRGSRALHVTTLGRRELARRFDLRVD
jgi:DNA-binding transcriptional ArsR family regulator